MLGNARVDRQETGSGNSLGDLSPKATLTSDGACLSTPGVPSCMSIEVYKVTITVTQ